MEVKWYKNDITTGIVLTISEQTLKQLSFRINLSFSEKMKVHESRYIALFEFSRSIKKLYSLDCVNICLFSIFLSTDFARWKKLFPIGWVNICLFSIFFQYVLPGGKVWGYPTLLILWFINLTKAYTQKYKRPNGLHN